MSEHITNRLIDVMKVIDDKTDLFPGSDECLDNQMFVLGEETGEAIGAYRRWKHRARRSGNRQDFELEIADVLITASIMAMRLGLDPEELMNRKLDIIAERGGR